MSAGVRRAPCALRPGSLLMCVFPIGHGLLRRPDAWCGAMFSLFLRPWVIMSFVAPRGIMIACAFRMTSASSCGTRPRGLALWSHSFIGRGSPAVPSRATSLQAVIRKGM